MGFNLGQLLAGLAAGGTAYDALEQRKRKQGLEDADRARAQTIQNVELGQQGIHILDPNTPPPTFDVNVSGGPDADAIVSRAMAGKAGAPNAAPLTATTSRALDVGPGYYVDRDEQAANMARSAQSKFMAAMQEALGKGAAENAIDPNARADRHAVAQSTVARNTAAANQVPEQGHVVDPVTGEVKFFDPRHPPQGLRVNPTPVLPSFTPVTVEPGDGEPAVIKPMNTRTGQVGPAIGTAKQATRFESATNTAAQARLEAAVSEMNNAHKGMAEYENALRNGTANINGLQQFASRAANAFTHDDPVSMAAQSAALAVLNKTNPPLARYIRRALSFAEGESMISQRPSDFRTRMSAFLSAAASGATPDMIHDIESRREAILTPLNRVVQPGPTKSAASRLPSGDVHLRPSASASHAQQLWDAAVAKYGEARVLQEYGPRPQE